VTPAEREDLRKRLTALPHEDVVNFAVSWFEAMCHHQNEALRVKMQLRDTVEKCRFCDGTGLVYDPSTWFGPVGDRPCPECRGSGKKRL
jgi:DnaJ-class molecular chaperone